MRVLRLGFVNVNNGEVSRLWIFSSNTLQRNGRKKAPNISLRGYLARKMLIKSGFQSHLQKIQYLGCVLQKTSLLNY